MTEHHAPLPPGRCPRSGRRGSPLLCLRPSGTASRRTPLLVLALALVASACGPTRPLVQNAPDATPDAAFPGHSVAQIVAAVGASVAPVRTASADGRLAVVMGGRREDATHSLRARLTGTDADSLTLVVRGPLGIEGARALVTTDEFVAADRINRRLYVGPVASAERYVPGAGSPAALARAVLGLLAPDSAEAWTVTPTDSTYILRAPLAAGGTREMTVDPALWRVVRVRDFDGAGTLVGEQEAGAFDTVDGVVLPRRVRLRAGADEAVFEHRSLGVNPADLRLRFARPTDYEVFELP